MALKVGELYGVLRLDDKDFSRGVDQSKGRFAGLVGGVAKGGMLIAGAVAGIGVAGGALSFKLANVASDMNESLSKVGVVFGDLGADIVAWSKGSADALGLSQSAALAAAGTYGNLFRAMGISEGASADMSKGLVNLSADLASFNNMDPTEVLDKLRAGLSGETEPLRTLGVNLSQARIEAKALEDGLWDGEGAISAAAKAQATYALILKDTTLAQGDFERTSDGMANQQRILGATFQDVMAQLGQAAIPIFESILPMLTEALSGLAGWATDNGPAIGDVLAGAFTFIGDTITFLAEEVIPRLIEAFTFFAEEILPIIIVAVGFVADEILPRLVAAFSAVAVWLEEHGPTIGSIVGQVFGAIANVVQAVWPIVEAVATVLFPLIATAAGILLGALDVAFKGIGGVFEVVGEVADKVFRAMKKAWGTLGTFFGGVWDGVGGAFKGGINAVIGLVNGLIGFLNNIRIDIPRFTIPGTDIGVGGGTFDPFNIGRIPYLGGGARNFGGGWAMIGERGPELMNVPRGADVYSNAELAAMLGGGGDVTVQMTVQPREVVDAYDIGLEARRAVRLGLRKRPRRTAGAGA